MAYLKINEDNRSHLCVAIIVFFSILSSVINSTLITNIFGYVLTILACYFIIKLSLSEGYLVLFGCLFMRAVIRFGLGSSHYSFLLIVFPLYLFKYVTEKKNKVNIILIMPLIIAVWDIIVGYLNDAYALGDQLSWYFSLTVLLIALVERFTISINDLLIVFCLAIWGICLINVFAELSLFGKTLVPDMYGKWNANNEYYMFGKAFPSIAGGNEIVQYVVLFIAVTIIHHDCLFNGYKPFIYLSCIAFLYFGIMCVSRAFYLELALFFFLFILTKTNRPFVFIAWLCILLIVLAIVYYRFNSYLEPVFNAVHSRFENGNESRLSLLDEAIIVINLNLNNTLFGLGSEYTELYDTVHNIIMDSILSLGILGSILYWWLIFKPAKFFLKGNSNFHIDTCIPLLMFVLYKMISGCIKDVPFYFMIFFVLSNMNSKSYYNSEFDI